MEGFHAYEFLLMKKLKEGALLFENKFTCKNTSDFRFGHYEKTSNLKLIVIVMNSHLRVKQWENHNDISLSDPTVHINLIKKRSVIIVDDENNIKYKNISPDFWFLSAALEKCPNKVLSFLNSEIKRIQEPHVSEQTVLDRYLIGSNIIEMHLDGVFKLGENAVLPIELFKCTNVKILSLKNNNLKRIPPDIGRLSQLEYLALTNNDLRNSSIPLTLTFCTQLQHLYVDNNMLDALPGFLLQMPQLVTVHRHGNHNYFKSTFMWYYTEINNRILHVKREAQKTPKKEQTLFQPDTLELLSAQAVIASKQNFFVPNYLPVVLQDYIAHVYPKFSICGYCNSAKSSSVLGFKVFTFKNPYLGNTCVPFQHWACSQQCAEAIEIPAHREQMKNAQKSDRQYLEYINYIQNQQVSAVQKKSTCSIM